MGVGGGQHTQKTQVKDCKHIILVFIINFECQ